jgi:DNA-directed RNA polymerase specialized sigma24 family protein
LLFYSLKAEIIGRDTTHIEEHDLVIRLQRQDKSALSYLYHKYGDALYGVAHRIIQDEDVTCEVVKDIFLKIGMYDSKKKRLSTWMLFLAKNTTIDKFRSKEVRRRAKLIR